MSLPSIFNSIGMALSESQIDEILETNTDSKKYGLMLSSAGAKELIEARNQVLRSYGRIELDTGITRKLIQHFCTSPFIDQEDYVTTLKDLQEIFYYMKNETEDRIGDDALIEIIKDFFDHVCEGSIELLKGRELEAFAKGYRRQNQLADYPEEEDYPWHLKL